MWFSRYEVSEATQDWIAESFRWAAETGLITTETPLVQATRQFFPSPFGTSPEAVGAVLRDIQRLLGIEDRRIDLAPIDRPGAEFRYQPGVLTETAGSWQSDGNSTLIRYDPELAARPVPFVAVLVHELMHEVLAWQPSDPPGGEEVIELSTDLHCITTGFGLLQMAGAEQMGWQGYLRQPTRAHALGLFLRMRDIPEAAASGIGSRSTRYLKRALREIDGQPEIVAGLRAVLRSPTVG
jgi:hypothetical protein